MKNELVESLRLGMEAMKLFFNIDEDDEEETAQQEEKLEVLPHTFSLHPSTSLTVCASV